MGFLWRPHFLKLPRLQAFVSVFGNQSAVCQNHWKKPFHLLCLLDTLNESPAASVVALRVSLGLSILSVSVYIISSSSLSVNLFHRCSFLSVLFSEKIVDGTQKRSLKKNAFFAFLLYSGKFCQLHYFIAVVIILLIKNSYLELLH